MMLYELHCRLGHISPQAVKELIWHSIVDGVILTDKLDNFKCQACIQAKLTTKSVPKIQEGECAKEFGEEIHSSLWGPPSTTTFGGR